LRRTYHLPKGENTSGESVFSSVSPFQTLIELVRYIHYQMDEALSSNSAEAEDLDLYMANIRTGVGAYSEIEQDIGVYEKHMSTLDMLRDMSMIDVSGGVNEN
jgi:hypothetical protein